MPRASAGEGQSTKRLAAIVVVEYVVHVCSRFRFEPVTYQVLTLYFGIIFRVFCCKRTLGESNFHLEPSRK